MGTFISAELTPELVPLLQQERFITLSSINREKGIPHVSAMSWVYAIDEKQIRFAVSASSRTAQNVSNEGQMVIMNVICAGSCYSIIGFAKVTNTSVHDIPIPLSIIDLQVEEVWDSMFKGSRISAEPQFEKIYDKEAAEKLDEQVMRTLKEERPRGTSA